MKFFKIVFRYADGKYSNTKNKIGTEIVQAVDEKDAEEKFGYSDVIAVREVTLEQIVAGA